MIKLKTLKDIHGIDVGCTAEAIRHELKELGISWIKEIQKAQAQIAGEGEELKVQDIDLKAFEYAHDPIKLLKDLFNLENLK